MSRFTPSPWRWGDWDTFYGMAEQPDRRNTLEHHEGHPGEQREIVRVREHDCQFVVRDVGEIREGDRELIRRAPELCEALVDLLNEFGGNMDLGRLVRLRALAFDGPADRFIESLADAPRPLTRESLDELRSEFYGIEGNGCGGTLHIVLDDGNNDRDDIRHCLSYARERGDLAGELFAEALLTLTDEQMKEWL